MLCRGHTVQAPSASKPLALFSCLLPLYGLIQPLHFIIKHHFELTFIADNPHARLRGHHAAICAHAESDALKKRIAMLRPGSVEPKRLDHLGFSLKQLHFVSPICALSSRRD